MLIKKNPKVDLRRKYRKVFEMSIILSLSLIILLFIYFPNISKSEQIIEVPQELVALEDIAITKHESAPPPPPKPIIPIETMVDNILEDIEIEHTELDASEVIDAPPPMYEEKVDEDIEEEIGATFFIAVEEMPEPIGGIQGIQQRIIYPDIARRAAIQGRVYIKAFVNELGDVVNAEIIKGIGAGCEQAAIKAVMETKFKPGKQRGKPVKVQVSVPVRFVLRNNV